MNPYQIRSIFVKKIMTKYAYANARMIPECLSNLMMECWQPEE